MDHPNLDFVCNLPHPNNMFIRTLCFTLVTMTLPLVHADSTGSGSDSGFSISSGIGGATETMRASEIKCLLEKVKVPSDQAQKTAEAMAQALQMIKFPSSRFTRISLLHFIAQIKSESQAGGELIEKGARSPSKTGYGLIQVTGPDNLKQAQDCMNRVQPGFGNGVASNPKATLGNPSNLLKPALASFCWWEKNIVQNDEHDEISKSPTEDDEKKIHEIVNTGHIGGKVTGGAQQVKERQSTFTQLKEGERQCRQISV